MSQPARNDNTIHDILESVFVGPIRVGSFTRGTIVSNDTRTQKGLKQLQKSVRKGPVIILLGHHDLFDLVRMLYVLGGINLDIRRMVAPLAYSVYQRKVIQRVVSQLDEAQLDLPTRQFELLPVFRKFEKKLLKKGYLDSKKAQKFRHINAHYQTVAAKLLHPGDQSRGHILAVAPAAKICKRGAKNVLHPGVARVLKDEIPVFFVAVTWKPRGLHKLFHCEVIISEQITRFSNSDSFEYKSRVVDAALHELEGDLAKEKWFKRAVVDVIQYVSDLWELERKIKNRVYAVIRWKW